MQRLHVDRRLGALAWRRKRLGRTLQQLRLPLRDLIRVNVVPLRELGHRELASYRLKGHFRFERRRVIPARSFPHRHAPLLRALSPVIGSSDATYPRCSDFRGQLSFA